MGAFMKGDVVVIDFPFSDLSQSKRRPALVVSRLKGIDLILCQITSKFKNDEYAIQLFDKDFKNGTLDKPSNVRPNILFTADSRTIKYRAGQLQRNKGETSAYLTEEKVRLLAEYLNEDPDVLLALSGKISQDPQEIIRKRPADQDIATFYTI